MVTIPNEMARVALAALAYCQINEVNIGQHLYRTGRDEGWEGREDLDNARKAAYYVIFQAGLNEQPRDVMGLLLDTIQAADQRQQQDPGEDHDPTEKVDLITLIADTLMNPYVRNHLSGEMITQLRLAILIPEETEKLKEAIGQDGVKCPCGHSFQMREAVTMSNGGKTPLIQCQRCSTSLFRVCHARGCENLVELGTGENFCPRHRENQEEPRRAARGGLRAALEGTFQRRNEIDIPEIPFTLRDDDEEDL